MDVIDRLDRARAERDVLAHPFYRRWSAGELSPSELGFYAGQYRHAVAALADASQLAADAAPSGVREGLERHAAEERAHIAMWDGFAAASGGGASATPLAQTAGCAESWTAGSDLLERLAVLYAIEASQPEISRTKLEGLREHYAFVGEGLATEYFTVHEQLDVEHAGAAAELIGELMAAEPDPEAKADAMVACAERALAGNWDLLSGVEAEAGAA
jgi:pyrroloquinoline-quinone synthase